MRLWQPTHIREMQLKAELELRAPTLEEQCFLNRLKEEAKPPQLNSVEKFILQGEEKWERVCPQSYIFKIGDGYMACDPAIVGGHCICHITWDYVPTEKRRRGEATKLMTEIQELAVSTKCILFASTGAFSFKKQPSEIDWNDWWDDFVRNRRERNAPTNQQLLQFYLKLGWEDADSTSDDFDGRAILYLPRAG